MPGDSQNLHQREAAFANDWAADTPIESILVRECFEAPTAQENRFILNRIGPLAGKRLLDIGAGLGESSVYFALQGAKVTFLDISPGMVETALRLGRLHGVKLEGIVGPVEEFSFPGLTFDIIYAANTIHHVVDRARLFSSMHRALRPGGRFFSWDPIMYNPVINVYRRMATGNRTPDETPLGLADLRLARRYFANVQHREFWIAALALLLKYYLFDRVHPNDDRYWKRILKETDQTLRWWEPLRAADALLTRIPGIRWLAWNMVMWGDKTSSPAPRH
jgi:SAM-dependent methyltransferase